jgi:hypothetical protein
MTTARDEKAAAKLALAAERQALAILRRTRIEKVRAQARQLLAATHARRRERSQALGALRKGSRS